MLGVRVDGGLDVVSAFLPAVSGIKASCLPVPDGSVAVVEVDASSQSYLVAVYRRDWDVESFLDLPACHVRLVEARDHLVVPALAAVFKFSDCRVQVFDHVGVEPHGWPGFFKQGYLLRELVEERLACGPFAVVLPVVEAELYERVGACADGSYV